MQNKILANSLGFKTFSYLKVNATETTMEKPDFKKYPLKSDEKPDINIFTNKEYGVSKEVVEMNEEIGNLYKLYHAKKDETIDVKIDLEITEENNELFDTHDIYADEGSSVSLLIDYIANDGAKKYRNSIIRIYAQKDSKVDVYVIQDEDENSHSMESIYAIEEENAEVNVYQYELGAKKTFTNFKCDLIGNESKLLVDSIYFAYGENELDMLYEVYHYGEDSFSEMVVNGALKDKAYKNFRSTLDFKKEALYAKGSEEEYTVLLDDDVTAISVPVLLAHEDSVEGNHAASAGKIDQELMFYIMSRGFSESEAKTLIVQSKFTSAIDRLPVEEKKEKIWERVTQIIRGVAHA